MKHYLLMLGALLIAGTVLPSNAAASEVAVSVVHDNDYYADRPVYHRHYRHHRVWVRGHYVRRHHHRYWMSGHYARAR